MIVVCYFCQIVLFNDDVSNLNLVLKTELSSCDDIVEMCLKKNRQTNKDESAIELQCTCLNK